MQTLPAAWVTVFAITFVWSGIGPKDTVTWMLEVAPAAAGAVILLVTRRRFPLTPLAYGLILVHCVILMIGGHYTYAEVPIGEWFRELSDPPRNNYDKLGHFAQGFVPALVAREVVVNLAEEVAQHDVFGGDRGVGLELEDPVAVGALPRDQRVAGVANHLVEFADPEVLSGNGLNCHAHSSPVKVTESPRRD